MKKITALFVFVFLFAATNVHALGGWRFIADKMVAFGVDHDVIVTGNTNDDFRKLKLRVTDGPLKMYDMKVYFDNGDVQDVSIRAQTGDQADDEGSVTVAQMFPSFEYQK